MFVPLRQLIWLFFLSVSHLNIPAQTVNLSSFQHTQRWVSAYNFPVYTNEKNVQDSIFAFTSSSLKNKLNAKQVNLPEKIEYDYIGGFGKAKMKNIKTDGPANDFELSILSFITRATAGFAIEWHMETRILQNGQRIFSNKTEHELEYYNVYGYMRPIAWMSREEFHIAAINKFWRASLFPKAECCVCYFPIRPVVKRDENIICFPGSVVQ